MDDTAQPLSVLSAALYVPRYKVVSTKKKATLESFEGSTIVLPLTMVKRHVASSHVRSTPLPTNASGKTRPTPSTAAADASDSRTSSGTAAPATGPAPRATESSPEVATASNRPPPADSVPDPQEDATSDSPTIPEETVDEPVVNDEFVDSVSRQLTEDDIEFIKRTIAEGQGASEGRRAPLRHEKLKDPPDEIVNYFRAVLGDIFHGCDRCKIPMKHEYKKGYYVALREAFLEWDKDILEEFERRLKAAGWSEKEIKNAQYFNSEMFRKCVPRVAPPPNELYWRVRAVFRFYGDMEDSKGKKLFNDAAWKRANRLLEEIKLGYYSDPPGTTVLLILHSLISS